MAGSVGRGNWPRRDCSGCVDLGATATIKAVVTNRGPSPAATILTTVAIPSGFTIASSGGGAQHGSNVLFTVPSGLSAHSDTLSLVPDGATTATLRAATVPITHDPDYRGNTIRVTMKRRRECRIVVDALPQAVWST